MRYLTLVFLLLFSACGGGELDIKFTGDSGPFPDVGNPADVASPLVDQGVVPDRDTGTTIIPDGSTTTPDMGADVPPAVCEPADCGPGASCQNNVCTCDDGLLGDPLVGCSTVNPCENVNCPDGASCNPDGSCSCDPFFTGTAATGCIPTPPPADLSARTKADVCGIWTARHARSSNDFFMVEPADTCDPGVLHPEEMRSALHTTSRWRMLVGLNPVSTHAGWAPNVQDCAMMHAANNARLNHFPPDTWLCYTQDGYDGCRSSNIAGGGGGVRQPEDSLSLYIQENGNLDTLGHRRWIFNPRMGKTAFGHRDGYGSMYAFDGSRSHNPDFVAYPAPGPFPRAAILGPWSIHGGATYSDNHTVTITNMSDASNVPVSDVNSPAFGTTLSSTLAWTVSTSQLAVDTTYRITIRDGGGALVREYDTTLVNCP